MGTYPHRSAPARASADSLLAQLRRILPARNNPDWHRRVFAREAIRLLCQLIRIQRRHIPRCGTCNGELADGESQSCQACRRMGADMAINEALATVRGLQRGDPPFDALTPAERQQQLDALMGDDSPDPSTRAQIERPADHAHIDLAEFARIASGFEKA